MSLAATVQWDVRTGGSDTNGGGFDPGVGSPGTDYSQQNSAQVVFTDLVIGATNTQLTSAGNPFSSASVGNIINITSGTGFTTGRYEILSVSGTTATMDRAVGTAASTGGHGNLGGSMATMVAAMNAASTSNTVWVQSGTYTQTTSGSVTSPNVTGTVAPLYCTGYGSTHGDGGTAPLLTTATNSVDLVRLVNSGSNTTLNVFTNINFSNTASTRGLGIVQFVGTGGCRLEVNQCKFTGFSNAINGDNGGSHGFFNRIAIFDSEIVSSTLAGIFSNTSTLIAIAGSFIHGGSSDGLLNVTTGTIKNTVFYGNSGKGINAGSVGITMLSVANSDFVANTSDGIGGISASGGQGALLLLENNIFYNNGGFGFNASAAIDGAFANNNNAYGSNTSGARNNLAAGINDVTLTADPFVGSSGGNFALNNSSGGGLVCRKGGFPGVFPGGASQGYLDIGAIQTSGGPSSSGGSYTFVA